MTAPVDAPLSPALAPARRSLIGAVARVFTFGLFLLALLYVTSALLAAPLAALSARTGLRVRVDELLLVVAGLAATACMLRLVDVRPWRDVGLHRDAASVRRIGAGAAIGGAAIGVVSLLLLATGWLRVAGAPDGSSLGAALRITAVLAPAALWEELVCRGYLLTALRDRFGTRGAVLATSALFGGLHVINPGATAESVLLVTLAGILLAAVRVAYDSLYAAWAAHLAWNWVMAVPMHALVSGQRFEAPDYRVVSAGPEWITGGAWGPEGGLAAGLGMMGGLAYLYARRRREES